ncbi:MAG: hypothetical protein U5K00_22790 [Melioribacteraceae bacterium]|nr:hypothetical protein [Melioribacteraceae bacterium]
MKNNGASDIQYWDEFKDELDLFTTSMIIDLSLTLKRKLKSTYKNTGSIEILINDDLVKNAINEVSSKQTKQDLEGFAQLYNEVTSLSHNRYKVRSSQLKKELKKNYDFGDEPPKPIGFRQPDID